MLGRRIIIAQNKQLMTVDCNRAASQDDGWYFNIPMPSKALIKSVIFNTESLLNGSDTPFTIIFMDIDAGATYGIYNFKENKEIFVDMYIETGKMILCYALNLNVAGCKVFYEV